MYLIINITFILAAQNKHKVKNNPIEKQFLGTDSSVIQGKNQYH